MLRRWCAAGGLLLTACANPTPPSPNPTAASPPVVFGTAIATVTETPRPTQKTLRLWVQPEFDPKADTPAGAELLGQLQRFEQINSGTQVEVRVKRALGAGGMIDSIRTGLTAAPGTLPDVIAIDARNLDAAAADDLILTLDALVNPDIMADYYPFALESGSRNGNLMGLPFAADALVAAYATTAYAQPPTSWATVLESAFPVIIPAADPESLFAVQQYLSLGGSLWDRSEAAALNTTVLTELLDYYAAARTAGVLTKNTLDFGSGAETWSAYRELRAPLVITSAHSYLQDSALAANTGAGPVPTQTGKPYVLAEVWSYALVNTDMARESGAWELLDWLVQPQNMGAWALKAGYLPPRADAVASWPPEAPADFAHLVLAAAHPKPDAETLAVIGPLLGEAVRNVIRGHATTSAAARNVIKEITAD
mgnify:FL=1